VVVAEGGGELGDLHGLPIGDVEGAHAVFVERSEPVGLVEDDEGDEVVEGRGGGVGREVGVGLQVAFDLYAPGAGKGVDVGGVVEGHEAEGVGAVQLLAPLEVCGGGPWWGGGHGLPGRCPGVV